jgi:hypothetical protein
MGSGQILPYLSQFVLLPRYVRYRVGPSFEQPINLLFCFKGTRYIALLLRSGFLKPFWPNNGLKQKVTYLGISLLNRFAYPVEGHKFSCQSLIESVNALCQFTNNQSVMQKQPHYDVGL